jgi:hypothetical protein
MISQIKMFLFGGRVIAVLAVRVWFIIQQILLDFKYLIAEQQLVQRLFIDIAKGLAVSAGLDFSIRPNVKMIPRNSTKIF